MPLEHDTTLRLLRHLRKTRFDQSPGESLHIATGRLLVDLEFRHQAGDEFVESGASLVKPLPYPSARLVQHE